MVDQTGTDTMHQTPSDQEPGQATRVYDTAHGKVGKWKSPLTGKWVNKRIPKGTADADAWFLAWTQEKLAKGIASGEAVAKRSQTIRSLVPRWQKHRLSLANADPRK